MKCECCDKETDTEVCEPYCIPCGLCIEKILVEENNKAEKHLNTVVALSDKAIENAKAEAVDDYINNHLIFTGSSKRFFEAIWKETKKLRVLEEYKEVQQSVFINSPDCLSGIARRIEGYSDALQTHSKLQGQKETQKNIFKWLENYLDKYGTITESHYRIEKERFLSEGKK